jgi:alpha-tubulin suppressor-like RCC1 family protein
VTPYIGTAAQTPVVFGSTATTQIIAGLTNGATYTFSVHGINNLGNDTERSALSNPVTPQAPLIDAGNLHTCALPGGGTVQCWGDNTAGQLGNGSTVLESASRVTVSGISDAVAVASGGTHSCALRAGGSIRCWGAAELLGDGTPNSSPTPVNVVGITTATSISAADGQTCARLADRTVRCWGWNGRGQLGVLAPFSAHLPVAVV